MAPTCLFNWFQTQFYMQISEWKIQKRGHACSIERTAHTAPCHHTLKSIKLRWRGRKITIKNLMKQCDDISGTWQCGWICNWQIWYEVHKLHFACFYVKCSIITGLIFKYTIALYHPTLTQMPKLGLYSDQIRCCGHWHSVVGEFICAERKPCERAILFLDSICKAMHGYI